MPSPSLSPVIDLHKTLRTHSPAIRAFTQYILEPAVPTAAMAQRHADYSRAAAPLHFDCQTCCWFVFRPGHRKAAKRRTLTNQSPRNFAHCLRNVWASRSKWNAAHDAQCFFCSHRRKHLMLRYLWLCNKMYMDYAQGALLLSMPRRDARPSRTTESSLSPLRTTSC